MSQNHQHPRRPKRKEMEGFNPGKPWQSKEVLAGYMAYEFLTKGTLLGQKLDGEAGADGEGTKQKECNYIEVSRLLLMKREGEGGPHVPGIVNPTQLARWIRM